MVKMAKGGFSRAALEEIQQLIKKLYAKVWEEKKRGVEFPGHNKVKAAIKRHSSMVCENQTDGWLPCQNGARNNPHTCWRHKDRGAPSPWWVPPQPGTPLAPSEDKESCETVGAPPGYVYIHTALPSARFFNLDPYAKDPLHDSYFNPDLLTNHGPSTALCAISCVAMQLTTILKMSAAFWVNLTVKTRVDWREWDCWVLSLSTISGHLKVYFKGYIYMHHERTM
jgi:hypothetical protein